MARRNDQVTFGLAGQTIAFRFLMGRPTSGTFAVYRSYMNDDAVPEFSGSCTMDAVDTTLSGAAGPAQSDPNNLPLTSVAGLVVASGASGAKYRLAQNGLHQWLELTEIGTTYARNRHPLQLNYTAGALVQSTRLVAAIDSTWASDRSKLSDLSDTYPDFRVKWTVVYAGATYVFYTFLDLLREVSNISVDIDDVNARAFGLEDSMPAEYNNEDGRPLIDAAWTSVRAHLQAINIDVNALRNNEALDELVILRALRILAEGGWHPPGVDLGSYITLTSGNYDRFFEQHYQAALKDRLDYQFGPLSRNLVIPTPGIWRK